MTDPDFSASWFEDSSKPYPPCFTDRTVRLLPKKCPDGSYEWNGDVFSDREWQRRWSDDKFPCLKLKDGSTPNETVAFRTGATTKQSNIETCWGNCKRLNHPSTWGETFRNFILKYREDVRILQNRY